MNLNHPYENPLANADSIQNEHLLFRLNTLTKSLVRCCPTFAMYESSHSRMRNNMIQFPEHALQEIYTFCYDDLGHLSYAVSFSYKKPAESRQPSILFFH